MIKGRWLTNKLFNQLNFNIMKQLKFVFLTVFILWLASCEKENNESNQLIRTSVDNLYSDSELLSDCTTAECENYINPTPFSVSDEDQQLITTMINQTFKDNSDLDQEIVGRNTIFTFGGS